MLAKIPIEGNIVQDYYIGNTHILVCDAAYVNNTPEDNQHVLDQAARAALNIILHNQCNHL
jgi:phage-related tail fiber protein